MGIDRRKFIKITGLSALGLATQSSVRSFASDAKSQITTGRTKLGIVIDLHKCFAEKNCTKCIDVCHKTHNVPLMNNPKHEIKWIWKEEFGETFHDLNHAYQSEEIIERPTPVFCNHCETPPCVKVCPTQATWKRDDGIVMMDWHRCIGCRYCMAACPYGSRSFNWTDPKPFLPNPDPNFPARMRGVVEKCTLCEERLVKGMKPACVEACTANAMIFGNLEDPKSEIREILNTHQTIQRKPSLGTRPQIYYII